MDIIRFKGGLGNQMFQYALLRSLESKGRKVGASLSFYQEHPELMSYELEDVFSNIKMDAGYDALFYRKYDEYQLIKQDKRKFEHYKNDQIGRFFWAEQIEELGAFQEKVFQTHNCIFSGYWQSHRYFEDIRGILLHAFEFSRGDSAFESLKEEIQSSKNYVSVHIRRGDYLKSEDVYGGICTEEYYRRAFEIVNELLDSPVYIFFSDDIEWVASKYGMDNAMYINKNLFETYENWYDMCLMSVSSINIIANSSFSWWGAWLNQRKENKVIAPGRWANIGNFKDICPMDWLRM